MTTISNVDLSDSGIQSAGYYESDAINLTDEAFIGLQLVKDANDLPDGKIQIIPLASNDGTNYAAIKDNKDGFVYWESEQGSGELFKSVSNLSGFFSLEPVRATSIKIRIPVTGISSGKVSLYVKTSMTEA